MNTEINPTTGVRVDVFGPTVEFLTAPQEAHNDFCVLRGVIPPGVSIPLHSQPDTEDFIIISGEIQALRQVQEGYEWITGRREIISMCRVAYGTPGATSPMNLWSHSFSRPQGWGASFRKRADQRQIHLNRSRPRSLRTS